MPDKQKKQRFDDPAKLAPKRRKGYRLITVDGHVFNWQFHYGDLLVLIGPGDRRRTFNLSFPERDDDEYYCCDWCEMGNYLTPRDVEPYARQMLKEMNE